MLELGEKLGAYKQNSEYEFHNHCHQLSLEHERALQCQKDEITTLKLTLKVRPVPLFNSHWASHAVEKSAQYEGHSPFCH